MPSLHAVRALASAPAPDALAALKDSTRIDFASDGLGLDPREYADALAQAVTADGFQPDYYSTGGVVDALESRFAALLGKETAVFMPTGTLANTVAVRTLAGPDRRVLVQAESHLYNDSGDAATTLAGLNLIPLAAGTGTITLDEVRRWLDRSAGGRVETKVGVIAIENPVRRLRHQQVDLDELDRVCALARAEGIRLHLDGARLFNLPLHCGRSVRELAAPFDTVYVSLWKHFNAASGAILAGPGPLIDGLRHHRRMAGGALPHAWPVVAPALQYVESYEASYAAAWSSAERIIALLREDGRFQPRRLPGGTSVFELATRDIDAAAMAARARQHGIVLPAPQANGSDFMLQVNATLLRRAPDEIAKTLVELASG
jgi:threonine aldolase